MTNLIGSARTKATLQGLHCATMGVFQGRKELKKKFFWENRGIFPRNTGDLLEFSSISKDERHRELEAHVLSSTILRHLRKMDVVFM